MKQILLSISLLLLPLTAFSQSRAGVVSDSLKAVNPATVSSIATSPTYLFGYFSHTEALTLMPEYADVKANIDALRKKYADELLRVEKEFNDKYEEFLEGQKDFPETILQKRQSELQSLLTRNIAFKEESRRLLANAEKKALEPLEQKLTTSLKLIGEKRGYSFILNTDSGACPFINATQGEDITPLLREYLKM
ncbi:MAG: OmpH family outer membrane protein [Prevotella sp.]|nr:OmpH family outer membrane protein [Prevotella sp.]